MSRYDSHYMIALLTLLVFVAPAQQQTLQSRINAVIARAPGKVNLYAKNLDTGKTFSIHGEERVRTASTIKLPVMIAAFGEVAAGRAKWTDTSTLRKEDKVSGSGILTEFSDGLQIPLIDLVHLMIVLSDNTATNLVLDHVSADTVNGYMDRYELPDTRALRKILGKGPESGISAAGKQDEFKAYGLGVSTPRDMVTLLEKIERGEAVSPEASKEMLAILKRQRLQEGIARKQGSTPVASKSGALNALRSDVGIVYSKRARIAMAITVDGMKKPDWSVDNPGHITISQVAAILVDGL